jgi:hypothetical protein
MAALAEIATAVEPGYRGLVSLCEMIGEPLEPHEKRIARAHFGPQREVYAILPRGNLKTTLGREDRATSSISASANSHRAGWMPRCLSRRPTWYWPPVERSAPWISL